MISDVCRGLLQRLGRSLLTSTLFQGVVIASFALSFTPSSIQEPQIETFSNPLQITIEENALPLIALEETFFEPRNPIFEKQWEFTQYTESSSELLAAGVSLHQVYQPQTSRNEKQFNEASEKNITKLASSSSLSKSKKAGKKWRSQSSRRVRKTSDKKSRVQEISQSASSPTTVANFSTAQDLEQNLKLSRRMRARLEVAQAMGVDDIIKEIQENQNPSFENYAKTVIEEELGSSKAIRSESGQEEDEESFPPEVIEDLKISGPVEVSGGLAFIGGEDQIRIFREFFGEVKEQGDVRLRTGTYAIDIDSSLGSLVAVLYDSEGKPKGEASLLLSEIHSDRVEKGRAEDVKLVIKPVINGARAKVLSSYSFDKYEMHVEGSEVRFSGLEEVFGVDRENKKVEFDTLARSSSFKMTAYAPNHWGTSVVGVTGVEQRIELFADSWVDALFDQMKIPTALRGQYSIVVGKVTANGETQAGASVEMAGAISKPIYFNSLMIPDPKQDMTASNGLFAFLEVSPGIHQVRARLGQQILPAEVFSANARQVSFVNIEKGKKGWVPLRVYDAAQSVEANVPAKVHVIGEDESVEVRGDVLFETARNESLMWIETAPFGDYVTTRVVKPRKSEHLLLPGLSADWLSGLKKSLSFEPQNKQVIIGFVNGPSELETYQVFLGSDAKSVDHRVVYFDKKGQLVTVPENGGGFAIFDVESGMQTVVIVPNLPLRSATHLVIADEEIVSVVQHDY